MCRPISWGSPARSPLAVWGLVELDCLVIRNFGMRFLSGTLKLQFQAGAFNLPNLPNFEPPRPRDALSHSKGAPITGAGSIAATATTSQQIPLALRLSW